jgi:hypothetical protein
MSRRTKKAQSRPRPKIKQLPEQFLADVEASRAGTTYEEKLHALIQQQLTTTNINFRE